MNDEKVTDDIFYKAMLHNHMLFVADQRYGGGAMACIARQDLCADIQNWLTSGAYDHIAIYGVITGATWYPSQDHNTVMEAVARLAASLIKLDERVSLKESLWPLYVETVNTGIKAAFDSDDINNKLERLAELMATVRDETALTDSTRYQRFEEAVTALFAK